MALRRRRREEPVVMKGLKNRASTAWRRMRIALQRGTRKQRIERMEDGFTLLEIIVAVAIIALVVGGVGLVAINKFRDSQVKQAGAVVKTVEGAVEMYMMDHNGECPKDLDELKSARIINKEAKDPWGEPLVFKCPGEQNTDGADISSKGPDKKEGTEDDIKNWEGE